jgi:uncharacterized protein
MDLIQLGTAKLRPTPAGDPVEGLWAAFMTESPDPGRIQEWVVTRYGVSANEARSVVYGVVSALNAKLFPPVTHLELIHTEGCNLGCSYCFEKNMLGYRRMSPDVARAAVDLLFDYSRDAPRLTIVHFGGEPTLNFRAIRLVTEYAEQRAAESGKTLEFDMTSNGVLLTDQMVDYFADHQIKVLLSIDGLHESHDRFRRDKQGRGTFDRVLRGMAVLKRRQRWIGAKMTVMPENAGRLYEDVRGLYDLGVNQFIIGYATGVNWPAAQMEEYADQLGRVYAWYKAEPRRDLRISDFDEAAEEPFFGCQAGKISITVAVNGEVSPCSKVLALNNRQLLGKLGDVQYGLTHLLTRSELVSCSKVKGACGDLGITDQYHGGCFASNYEANGDLFQPNLVDHTFSLLQRSRCAGCTCHQ